MSTLCNSSRRLYLYITPIAHYVMKVQIWSPHVHFIDLYTLNIGEHTATLIGKVTAGYDTDIDDIVAQCINFKCRKHYIYILPLKFLNVFYWYILRQNLGGVSGVLPKIAPSGPNGLIRVSDSVLPSLMNEHWILFTCAEINGQATMSDVLERCIDTSARLCGISYNSLFSPPLV
jgi:hypothetical protein